MIKKLISPAYLLPLSLVSPYIFAGVYGVTVVEVVVALTFCALVATALVNGSLRLPKFLVIYLVLYTFGWAGAFLNGTNWGMRVGVWNVTFFYKIVLAIGAYHIGHRLYCDLDTVVTGKFCYAVILGLAALAAVYPFLTYDQRFGLLKVFYASGEWAATRLASPRFPGLGINANIYSFMVFPFLLFSFDAYLRKRVSAIVPLLSFVVIVSAASKLVMFLSAGACLLLLFRRLSIRALSYRRETGLILVINKRAVLVLAVIAAFLGSTYIYFAKTSSGEVLAEKYVAFERISELLGTRELNVGDVPPLEARLSVWQTGFARVQLAPVLGIVRDPYVVDDVDLLFVSAPHNEYLVFWTNYGLLGLVAHLFLLGYLVACNAARGRNVLWITFYAALAIQMFFDAAFDYPRFQAMFFLFVGMNMKYLQLARSQP